MIKLEVWNSSRWPAVDYVVSVPAEGENWPVDLVDSWLKKIDGNIYLEVMERSVQYNK